MKIIKSSEINPYFTVISCFTRVPKQFSEGKNSLQHTVLGHFDIYKGLELCLSFTSHTKIKSKWIVDPNIKVETIKLLEKNIVVTL